MPESNIDTILFVHSSDELYGADLILLELVEHLAAKNIRPIVVVPTDVEYEGKLSNALSNLQIQTIPLKTAILRRKYFTPWGICLYLWRFIVSTVVLIRLIRRESVDIVHSNTAAVIPGAVAARFTGVPHVWHIHEIIVSPRPLWKFTSWLLPRLSGQVVAVSGPTKDHLCKGDRRNCEKVIVIHNGIKLDRFENQDLLGEKIRQEWGIDSAQVLVGMVGRVSTWKGQKDFLRAAQLVSQAHSQARFALVGGVFPGQEHLFEELQVLAKSLEVDKMVRIEGFRRDIPAVLNAYDIFVLPSTLPDPFPTVILEAMASSLPVVAYAHGGSQEMIISGQTGYLIKPGNIVEMADAIGNLIDNPTERQAFSQRGRVRLEQSFSMDAFLAQWLSVYETALMGKNR